MNAQPMIAVQDVRTAADFYEKLLGAHSAHGGAEYEQLVVNDRLVLQLHDCRPDPNHGPLRDLTIQPGNGVLLWFKTQDFEAATARAKALPGHLIKGPAYNAFGGHMELWLKDLDGYQIVIAGPSKYDKEH